MRDTLSLFFIILGTIIGAGFATGKEIAVYFASHGLIFILFAFLGGFLFYYANNLYLNLSYYFPINSFTDFSRVVFKKAGGVFNFFLNFSYFIICGSMFAGINAISEYILPLNFPILSIITAIATLIICSKGIKAVAKANTVIMPLIVITIICIAIMGITNNAGGVQPDNYVIAPFSAVIYVGMNVILSGVFLAIIGQNYTYKQNKLASILSSVVIIIIVLVVGLCLVLNPHLLEVKLPLISLGFSISKAAGITLSIIVWFAIFTSLISNTYTLNNMLFKDTNIWSNMLIIAIGYILSLFGFDKIHQILQFVLL